MIFNKLTDKFEGVFFTGICGEPVLTNSIIYNLALTITNKQQQQQQQCYRSNLYYNFIRLIARA